ncbi:MAG: 4-alpha-glucanotransferase [Desulfuromonadaceae bacterium]|nr:4-alpha-glucanotransferase [Desulfuromonadaceae bacterium]MDD2856588.1 4-alpha-glucanotransferase [Desulfuromonadaceae bacterium]
MKNSTLSCEEKPTDSSISQALNVLGKTDFLLAVHDASFPSADGEDSGRGTPYSSGGYALASFAASLGFTGVQLGPQGGTSEINQSPYDGTIFSRNILSLDLKALVDLRLLSFDTWKDIIEGNPEPDGRRVTYSYAFKAYNRAMDEVYKNFAAAREANDRDALTLDVEIKDLQRSARWLRDDSLYEALSLEHDNLPWHKWGKSGDSCFDAMLCAPTAGKEGICLKRRSEIELKYAPVIERYSLLQLILLKQHSAFRKSMESIGLKIYGDLQVGFSQSDCWSLNSLILQDYFLGAPPSRTNLEGQPWSYQVLDPAQYLKSDGKAGAVLDFVAERLGKMLSEFDGLRLDHPHGLVCPWVYRRDDADPYHAVQNGARLFSSPDLPDHPALSTFSVVHQEQINRGQPRYADNWINEIIPEQEDKYALIMDALMQQVLANSRRKEDILCEVLSTEPLPLRNVRLRHELGRFRVTQKADLNNPADVYRSENSETADWIMVGNHDTPTIWKLAKGWFGKSDGVKQAEYLAERLDPDNREHLAELLAADPRRLVHAKMADLFLGKASHVMIFFADLFGLEESYNLPGIVNEENWTLRVPHDFERIYMERRLSGEVLNLHAVLALALRGRRDINSHELIARLDNEAGWRVDSTL